MTAVESALEISTLQIHYAVQMPDGKIFEATDAEIPQSKDLESAVIAYYETSLKMMTH